MLELKCHGITYHTCENTLQQHNRPSVDCLRNRGCNHANAAAAASWMQSTHSIKTGQELCTAVNECLTIALFALMVSCPAVCTEYILLCDLWGLREQEQPVAGYDSDYFCRIVVADTHVFPALRKWNITGDASDWGIDRLCHYWSHLAFRQLLLLT